MDAKKAHTLFAQKIEAEKKGDIISFTQGGYAALMGALTDVQAVLIESTQEDALSVCQKANQALRKAISTLNDNLIITHNA